MNSGVGFSTEDRIRCFLSGPEAAGQDHRIMDAFRLPDNSRGLHLLLAPALPVLLRSNTEKDVDDMVCC